MSEGFTTGSGSGIEFVSLYFLKVAASLALGSTEAARRAYGRLLRSDQPGLLIAVCWLVATPAANETSLGDAFTPLGELVTVGSTDPVNRASVSKRLVRFADPSLKF